MKNFVYSLPVTALFASSALAWLPSCSWNDCIGSWDGSSCDSGNGWDCVCSDPSELDKMNSCVQTSCSASSDQEAIYEAIAQLCANAGETITAAAAEATFSATSGGSAWPTITGAPSGWGPAGWSSWISACSTALPGPPGGWSSGGGPWGGPGLGWNSKGPWGGTDCAWSTWTAGWGPWSTWTGTWSGCSTTTASPEAATITTTINGEVLTGTTFGVQAVQTASISSYNAAPTGLSRPGAGSGAFALALAGAVMAL